MSINEFVEMTIFLCLIRFSIHDKMQGFIDESGLFIFLFIYDFCEKSPVDSADTLQIKNFVKIDLSHSISEINAFLRLRQKCKMAAKSDGKMIFGKSRP